MLIGFVLKYGVTCKSSPVHRDIIFKFFSNIYVIIFNGLIYIYIYIYIGFEIIGT